jgi:taurine transport system ATP-binding protein
MSTFLPNSIHANSVAEEPLLPSGNGKPIAAQLIDIGVTFNNGNQPIEVLKNINLAIAPGDFVCVLGSSGCGKTTLLRILAGYQKATAGRVAQVGCIPHPIPM